MSLFLKIFHLSWPGCPQINKTMKAGEDWDVDASDVTFSLDSDTDMTDIFPKKNCLMFEFCLN